jgi:hypothetical protein
MSNAQAASRIAPPLAESLKLTRFIFYSVGTVGWSEAIKTIAEHPEMLGSTAEDLLNDFVQFYLDQSRKEAALGYPDREVFVGYNDLVRRNGETYLALDGLGGEETSVFRLVDYDVLQLFSKDSRKLIGAAASAGTRRYGPALPKLVSLIPGIRSSRQEGCDPCNSRMRPVLAYWQQNYEASDGLDAESLRAMRTYRANPGFHAFQYPYYWAGFTCNGAS